MEVFMVKIAVVSLGCNKNLVDSEMILGLLVKRGYQIVPVEEEADIVIINTCAFINDAKQESINKIIEVGKLKDLECKAIIVTGCLANRYEKEIKEALPEVDCIAKINDYETIINFIDEKMGTKDISSVRSIKFGERIRSTYPHVSYVKIADGCDNRCTYCVIPYLRGAHKSREIGDVLEEVNTITEEGVTEVILTAQDTTYYGLDNYKERKLASLISEVVKNENVHWIRFQYAYPEGITDELLEVIKNNKKVCKYFDIPIQHCSDEVLKRMGRHTNKKEILRIINTIRRDIPDAVIRTSLIVGFPGETEEQFDELLEFVKEVKFDRLGVFTYSKEEGTPAAKLKDQIPERIKKNRQGIIMSEQQKISFEKNKEKIGKEIEILVESKLPDGTFCGRTYQDAPEIDGLAFINSERELVLGEYYMCRVVEAKEYDVVVEVI